MRIGRLSITWGPSKKDALRKLQEIADGPPGRDQLVARMFLLKHADPSFHTLPPPSEKRNIVKKGAA